MGNKLQIPQILNSFQGPSNNHTYDELREKVHLINSVFKQIHQKIMLNIELSTSSIRYQPLNWKKSTVKGFIHVQNNKLSPQLSEETSSLSILKENILLSYEDINTLYDQMKNLDHSTKQTPKPQKSQKFHNANQNTHQTLLTPSSTVSQQKTPQAQPAPQSEQCCICFQKTPSMVLPCSHAFCDNCTVKYIIEADEKKCPQCRQEIKGSRQAVEKQIFTLIQDDEVNFLQKQKRYLNRLDSMFFMLLETQIHELPKMLSFFQKISEMLGSFIMRQIQALTKQKMDEHQKTMKEKQLQKNHKQFFLFVASENKQIHSRIIHQTCPI